MTTTTTTLADFLLARISEDMMTAKAATPGPWVSWPKDTAIRTGPSRRQFDFRALTPADADAITRHDPARVLAECEAKRQVIEHCASDLYLGGAGAWSGSQMAWDVLTLMGLPYADHPDYRPEWHPGA